METNAHQNQTYKTMNELQMSSYVRQYNVLGVETRDHVTANYQTHDGQARDDANNATEYTSC